MATRLPTYLRTHRRSWALSQRELAVLLGNRSDTTLSRYEWLVRPPSRDALIGLEFIFAQPSYELFPAIGLPVIRAVMGNAVSLREVLLAKSDAASARKRRFLDDLITRSAHLLSAYE